MHDVHVHIYIHVKPAGCSEDLFKEDEVLFNFIVIFFYNLLLVAKFNKNYLIRV